MTERPPQRGEVRHTLRERQILDAAYDLLRSKGFVDMSMDDVSQACGVSKATLYKHFSSKDELVVAVVEEHMARSEEVYLALDPARTPLARLEQLLVTGVERRTRHAPIPIQQMPGHLLEHPRLIAQRRAMFARMSTLVAEAQAAGQIRSDVSLDLIVGHLMMTFGPSVDHLAELRRETPAVVAQGLLPVVLDGLAPRPPVR